MSDHAVAYVTPSAVRLTDYTDGQLENAATKRRVPASHINRRIAAHFQEPALWNSFDDHADPIALGARAALLDAGILRLAAAPDDEISFPTVTMFGAPTRVVSDVTPSEIVFLGAPIDFGTTGAPGARFGPDALRLASTERFECEFDILTGRMTAWNVPMLGGAVLGGARLSDLGNLTYLPGEPQDAYYARLQRLVQKIYTAGGFPVVLGGDHSITYATVPETPVSLVHLDAHCDLAILPDGYCHHHGNVLRRLLRDNKVQEIHHFGLRDTGGWDTTLAGTFAHSAGDLERAGWSDGIHGKEVFVSLDVDVLDPSIAPATGTPVIGGLNLRQLCQVLAQIAAKTHPIGLDVVEVCPMKEGSSITEHAVIEAILVFLAIFHRQHSLRAD